MKTNFTLAWLLIFVTTLTTWSQTPKKDSVKFITPNALAFCGGGRQLGLTFGAFPISKNYVDYSQVQVMAGTSAGCIGVLALLLNYSDDEVFKMWQDINFRKLRGKWTPHTSPFSLYDGNGIKGLVEMMLKEKGYASDITMYELSKRLGINVYFLATLIDKDNKNSPTSIAFGDSIHSQISVALAVQISSSVPNYLRGFSCNETATKIDSIYNKHSRYTLVDGNFLADYNFPLRFVAERVGSNNVLGFYISNGGKSKEIGLLSIISYNLGKKNDQCVFDSLRKNGLMDKAIILNANGICSPMKKTSLKRLNEIYQLGKQQAEIIFKEKFDKKHLAASPR